ncbi:MAG: hypothetical protein B7Z16_17340, partial [Algoriphagus sp. 32-45-6]
MNRCNALDKCRDHQGQRLHDPIKNQVYLINSGGGNQEYVRVLAVMESPFTWIRVSTVNTHVATETLTGETSYRFLCTATITTSNTLTNNYIQAALSGGGQTGVMYTLAQSNSGTLIPNGRPVEGTDKVHLCVQFSNTSNVSSMVITFNLDPVSIDFQTN